MKKMEKILEIGMEGGSHIIFREKSGNGNIFIYKTEEFIDLDEFPELADYVPPEPKKFSTFELAFKIITDRFSYWPKLYFIFIKIEFHQFIENQLIEYLNNQNQNVIDRSIWRISDWQKLLGKEAIQVGKKWQFIKFGEPKESIF